jgi:hypothetical protein
MSVDIEISGLPGESFADVARRIGSIGGVPVSPEASDQQILELMAAGATAAAEAAQVAAELARDLAQAAAATAPMVYADATAGLAAVGEGETFWVEESGRISLYRDESGVATALTSLVTAASGLDLPEIRTGFTMPTVAADTRFSTYVYSGTGTGENAANEAFRIGSNISEVAYVARDLAEPQLYWGLETWFEGRMECYFRFHRAGGAYQFGHEDRETGYVQPFFFKVDRVTGLILDMQFRAQQCYFQDTDGATIVTILPGSVTLDVELFARAAQFDGFAYTTNNRWFGSKNAAGAPSALLQVAPDNVIYLGDIYGGFGASLLIRVAGHTALAFAANGAATFSTGVTVDGGINAGGDISAHQALIGGTGVYVAGQKVVGTRGAAIADATDNASAILCVNQILAHLRAHGLIAA